MAAMHCEPLGSAQRVPRAPSARAEGVVVCVRVASRDAGPAGEPVAEALRDFGLPVERIRAGGLLVAGPGCARGDGLLSYAAARVLGHVQRRTGVSCVAGAGRNRVLAYFAASLAPTGGTFVLARADVPVRIWPLPVRLLPGAGPREWMGLRRTGAETIGDVAALGPDRCARLLGSAGRALWAAAYGRDPRPLPQVPPTPKPLSLFASGSLDLMRLMSHPERLERRAHAPGLPHAG